MIYNINTLFYWLGHSSFSMIYENKNLKKLLSSQWIVHIRINNQNNIYNFYIIKDEVIKDLDSRFIVDYRDVRIKFTNLCLNPNDNDEMFLENEAGAEWVIGSFLDLYLYNYFDSQKVENFTKSWKIKDDGIPVPIFNKILKELSFKEVEKITNDKFGTH